jgi:hypothetical protein
MYVLRSTEVRSSLCMADTPQMVTPFSPLGGHPSDGNTIQSTGLVFCAAVYILWNVVKFLRRAYYLYIYVDFASVRFVSHI